MPAATSSSSPETFSPSRSRATSCSPRCGRSSTVHERAPVAASASRGDETPMRQSIRTCALVDARRRRGGFALSLARRGIRQTADSLSGRLVLGVVRNDGLLLPFAAFDGRKWSTPWPGDIGGPGTPDLPVNLASVPAKWWGGRRAGPLESLAARCREPPTRIDAAVAGDDAGRLEPPAWIPHRPAVRCCRPFRRSSCPFRRSASPSPAMRSSSRLPS